MADFKQSLNLRQSQQLLMTPQLQQAIKLLQLSRLELEEFVTQQLEENPVLEEGAIEVSEERQQSEDSVERTEDQANSDHIESGVGDLVDKVDGEAPAAEVDWDQFNSRLERTSSSSTSTSSSSKNGEEAPNYENIVTRSKSLQEHLMAQIGELDLDDDENHVASILIGNIDDRGYLQTSCEEIASMEDIELDLLEDILDVIQHLDPPGVGARDLKDCLLIQLRLGRLRNGVVEKVVDLHLSDLETRNYQAIVKSLKIPMEKVIESVQTISELDPVPGRQFSIEAPQYVVPDVYVFKMGVDWVVGMNEDGLPKLRVSDLYRDMAKGKEAKVDDKAYLQEKLKSADWLIKSIQQRQRTIFRVAECIVKRQREFFEVGVQALRPMILKDIAEDIEMHESTISRVTSNKYMHTPRGIFELKYFFNSSVSRSDGDSVASEAVKQLIDQTVKSEDPKKPLSDQQIVEILEVKGIQLARRTVAKYREQLGIAPSSRRKRFY